MSSVDPQRTERVTAQASAPPAGEAIHVPGNSVLPLLVAIGITLAVIGLTVWWVWSALGLIIFFVAGGLWVRDARREFMALPDGDEHH